jgi:membrane-bound ClpP family serine protease
MGAIGSILTILGLFALMMPGLSKLHFSFSNWTGNLVAYDVFNTFVWVCGSFVVSFITIILLAKFVMPKFAGFKYIVNSDEQSSAKGYVAKKMLEELPILGTEAVVLSPLKPFGRITVDDIVYEAYSEIGFIDKGKKVIIIKIKKNHIIVREI